MSEGTIADVLTGAATWAVVCGDSATVEIPPCSLDAIITDPPAGIAFMGREWDADKGGKEHWIAWLAGILRRAYAALKPGGHLVCWALPRTSHWTAEAIERAGFEIRDKVSHVFGSGFPKSLDVSKAIDAARGAERPVIGSVRKLDSGVHRVSGSGTEQPEHYQTHEINITAPATPEAARWSGWGTALKPAAEDWILARKPLASTVVANVMEHGTGALNIDACRVAGVKDVPASAPKDRENFSKGAERGRTMDTSGFDPNVGRWPANFVLSHCAYPETECRACGLVLPMAFAFCPACGSGDVAGRMGGCCDVGTREVKGGNDPRRADGTIDHAGATSYGTPGVRESEHTGYGADGLETVPAWACLATCDCGLPVYAESGGAPPRCKCGRPMRWACPVAALDEQSGSSVSNSAAGVARYGRSGGIMNPSDNLRDGRPEGHDDSGGASRFFNTFAPDPWEPFLYAAKPSTAETEAGCDALPVRSSLETVGREADSPGAQSPRAGAGAKGGRRNHHPTKKGLRLMRHFVRLVTPPGGVVLDLFGGSCTTGAAVAIEAREGGKVPGARCILVEQDPAFVAIGRARIAYWERGGSAEGPRVVAGAIVTAKPAAKKSVPEGQGAFDFGGSR